MTTPDHICAHRHSARHREEVLASERCGYFYHLATFPPSEIERWVDLDLLPDKDYETKAQGGVA
jgi:hypothetical protein